MRTVRVPGFSDSGSLYQQVEVPEPGDAGYTGVRLPDADPWAKYINPVIDQVDAGPVTYVTEISVPGFDNGTQRLHSRMLAEPAMTEAEAEAATELDAWGPRGPSASYAEWVAEGREPEAGQ